MILASPASFPHPPLPPPSVPATSAPAPMIPMATPFALRTVSFAKSSLSFPVHAVPEVPLLRLLFRAVTAPVLLPAALPSAHTAVMASSMPVKNVMTRTGSAETAATRSVSGKTRSTAGIPLLNSLRSVTMEGRMMATAATASVVSSKY